MSGLSHCLRFAPSPNGYLHLGHALSALLCQQRAQELEAKLLLRIEDIDTERCTTAFTEALLEDLAWIGFKHEPVIRYQSQHMADYRAALENLNHKGLVYQATLSRKEIASWLETQHQETSTWPKDPDGTPHYPRHLNKLPTSDRTPFAWRLNMDKALEQMDISQFFWQEKDKAIQLNPAIWGDVVLARKDTPTSYHLSVVVDDALQGVTHVVRGIDLQKATCIHRLLQVLLEYPTPHYEHHRLILDETGEKLSKSTLAKPLRQYRKEGFTPSDIRRLAGM